MRTRSLPSRIGSALLALWFALAATESAVAHACPMHGGAAAAAAAPVMATAPMDGGAHAGHVAQGTSHSAPDGHAHLCTCLGTCCGASSAAAPAPRLSLRFGVAVADVRAVFAPPTERHAVADAFLRPFANGPPARALA